MWAARGPSTWEIAGDWNVRPFELTQEQIQELQGISPHDASARRAKLCHMYRFGNAHLLRNLATKGSGSATKYLSQCTGWLNEDKDVDGVKTRLLLGDGVQVVQHCLENSEAETRCLVCKGTTTKKKYDKEKIICAGMECEACKGSGVYHYWRQTDWIEPDVASHFEGPSYPIDPEFVDYRTPYKVGGHQVPAYLDRVFRWEPKDKQYIPGTWKDLEYRRLNTRGSDHFPVQKIVSFEWRPQRSGSTTAARLARMSSRPATVPSISPKPQGDSVATKQKSDSMSSVKTTADSKDPDPTCNGSTDSTSSSDGDGMPGVTLDRVHNNCR